jgi:hypothetical protein
LPCSRVRCIDVHQSPSAGGGTGTSVGGSTNVAALAPPLPRVVRRLAGLPAGVAGAERRLRLELLDAAAALREDMGRAGETARERDPQAFGAPGGKME